MTPNSRDEEKKQILREIDKIDRIGGGGTPAIWKRQSLPPVQLKALNAF